MKLVKLLMLLALTASKFVHAQEHPACSNLEYHYEDHASEQLRTIAAFCNSTSIAYLYYNRAHHTDLILEATMLSGLISYSSSTFRGLPSVYGTTRADGTELVSRRGKSSGLSQSRV